MRSERELLVDCLERLNRLSVPYMLVGSMASNYWGIPRTTHDLDFVLALQPADIESLAAAFGEGFFIQVESVRRAFSPPHQFNAIDEKSALKVDFWLLKPDAFEHNAFERRRPVSLFGTPAWIMTAEDVILHKFYWHTLSPSDRQLHDAAGVFAVQGDALDMIYLRHWAPILHVGEQLAALLAGRLKPKTS
ncbi:MAG: hypothetical protein FJ276_16645 [Planctomycetes bacterium]|nr:hypothetical protein [Planctomycetota bacterium]